MAKFYQVGGYVRDEILGIKSKDIDYAVEAESYEDMCQAVKNRGCQIFMRKPEFLTIRAKDPSVGVVDFVLCRKDGEYVDGRRPDTVIPGTLHNDLARRDFTMNAIAKSENGNYIDPYGGIVDIKKRLVRCVGSPYRRFSEDHLRILRAIRFAVTKEFYIDKEVSWAIHQLKREVTKVSIERIREELTKAFRYNTPKTLMLLGHYGLVDILFNKKTKLKLMPTLRNF